MPEADYSPKRLRDLCVHIHEDNMALPLRAALPEFAIDVIDKFFTGPKVDNLPVRMTASGRILSGWHS